MQLTPLVANLLPYLKVNHQSDHHLLSTALGQRDGILLTMVEHVTKYCKGIPSELIIRAACIVRGLKLCHLVYRYSLRLLSK